MKTKINLPGAALALFFLNFQHSTALGQGSLTPPGPPGATMLTLSQIEPRTPISSVPITITQSGSYYLTTNVTATVSNAITIAVSGVTLDLNGFTISSTVANAAYGGTAILLASGLSDITICNGHIVSGVTNNGSGVYSGSGFGLGITFSGIASPVNVLVSRVAVSGCLYYGIFLNNGDSIVVESCTVRTVGSFGIVASTIKQTSAIDCGGIAVYGDQVSDCRGQSTGSGDGLYASATAQNCYGQSSSGDGIYVGETALNCNGYSSSGNGLQATNAENCSGYSSSGDGLVADTAESCNGYSGGSGDGIHAATVENCNGYSGGNGNGLYAGTSAQNCYGQSSGGDGLYAGETALNCNGYSSSGSGLVTDTAQTCNGYSGGSGFGLYASATAQNCYGSSSSGFGVYASETALNCYGSSSSGNGLQTEIAQNCSGVGGGSADGLYAFYSASGCYGYSASGTGLYAFIASVCHGATSSGTALSSPHNVNSY